MLFFYTTTPSALFFRTLLIYKYSQPPEINFWLQYEAEKNLSI